jgi:hypothetical protein
LNPVWVSLLWLLSASYLFVQLPSESSEVAMLQRAISRPRG